MAFYTTRIDDNTIVFIESETSGAFSKSDLEIRPDPEQALLLAIDMVGKVAQAVSTRVGNALDGTNMAFEITFGIKADGNGSVMIAQTPNSGQLLVRVAYKEE